MTPRLTPLYIMYTLETLDITIPRVFWQLIKLGVDSYPRVGFNGYIHHRRNHMNDKTAEVADDIFNELIRLAIDINLHPTEGLMAYVPNLVVDEICLVRVASNCDGGFYDGGALLVFLRSLEVGGVSVYHEADEYVWPMINKFAV